MKKSSKLLGLLLALCMVVALAAPTAFAAEPAADAAYDLTDCKPVKITFPITNAPEYLETKCTETWMDHLVMVDEKTDEKVRSPKTGERDVWWLMLLFLGACVAGCTTLVVKSKQDGVKGEWQEGRKKKRMRI